MKKPSLGKVVGLLAAVGVMAGAQSVKASLVTVDKIIYQSGSGVNGSLFSGTVDITVTGAHQLTILVRNTSPDSAVVNASIPAQMLLSGFGLQLPGVDIIGGSVSINGGSTAVNFQSSQNLSYKWGYANSAIQFFGGTGVDSVVTTVGGNNTPFKGSSTLQGPAYGAVSASETQFGSSQAAIRDTIKFILTLNGTAPTVAQIDSGKVVLAFGSANAVATPVPEPST